MTTEPLLGHRWILTNDEPEPERFRQKETAIHDFVTPVLFDGQVLKNSTAWYASKQASETWLTLFCHPSTQSALVYHVTRHQPSKAVVKHVVLTPADPILAPGCETYRSQLKLATRFALDLHPRHGLRAHQCALIRIACKNQDPRAELDVYLSAHSPFYKPQPQAIRTAFWADFLSPGPPDLSYYGHWIWNIVLGVDAHPNPWPEPALVEDRIGIRCNSV